MTVDERQKQLVSQFAGLDDWEDRYRKIIALGRDLPHLPDALKQERFRVKGCQSQVWLHASLDDEENVIFQADSDAMIVRGLIAILLRVYSEATPLEILHSPPRFIEEMGLAGHLSPTRTNGLHSMVEQMMYYAKAFQTVLIARSGAGEKSAPSG